MKALIMAIALVANTGAGSTNQDDVTTPAINTTGADLLLAFSSALGNVGDTNPAILDSKGNVWTPAVTAHDGNYSARGRLYYTIAPIVGSGHTFTADSVGSLCYPAIAVAAFSGIKQTLPLGGTNQAWTVPNGVSIAPGAIIPFKNGALCISGLSGGANPLAVGNGFTILNDIAGVGGQCFGGALGYYIQPQMASINPLWSWSGSQYASTVVASFKTADAGFEVIGGASGYGTTGSATTGTMDSTGANLILLSVSSYQGSADPVISDSKFNTWFPFVTRAVSASSRSTLYYAYNTSLVGAGHTFTAAGTSSFPSICAVALSGAKIVMPADQQTGAAASAATSLGTGSITPTDANQLVVATLALNTGVVLPSISGPFVLMRHQQFQSGVAFGSTIALSIQNAATAANPTWSWSGSSNAAATISSFKLEQVAAGRIKQYPGLSGGMRHLTGNMDG